MVSFGSSFLFLLVLFSHSWCSGQRTSEVRQSYPIHISYPYIGGTKTVLFDWTLEDDLTSKLKAWCLEHGIHDLSSYNLILANFLEAVKKSFSQRLTQVIEGTYHVPLDEYVVDHDSETKFRMTFRFTPEDDITEKVPLLLDQYRSIIYNQFIEEKIHSEILHAIYYNMEYSLMYPTYKNIAIEKDNVLDVVTDGFLDLNAIKNTLIQIITKRKNEFLQAKPFPHMIINELFPTKMLRLIASEFPAHGIGNAMSSSNWHKFEIRVSNRKLACGSENCFGPMTGRLISFFKSQIFVEFLELLTGIDNILPDPKYYGGGLHQIQSGGHLSIHADFARHQPNTNLIRRVNVFLYLNEGWQSGWGGNLELWNADISKKEVEIEPYINRLVIFTTSNDSFHGHPNPLACPENVTRKSIALYYYTVATDNDFTEITNFQPRPGEEF